MSSDMFPDSYIAYALREDKMKSEEMFNTVHSEANGMDFVAELAALVSREHGFTAPSEENLPRNLILSISELTEAMEEHRDEKPLYYEGPDGKPEGVLSELADSIIRNFDIMHSLISGTDLPSVSEVIVNKMRYNAGRPYMHGRAY